MYDEVRVVYGPTGGRFAFLSGIVDALEERLHAKGIRILDRIGVSGGALSASIKASGEDFTSWLKTSSQLRKQVEIGNSFRANIRNFTALLTKGGMIDASKVLNNMFRVVAPEPPYDVPCYAIAWCSTLKRGVAFNVAEDLDVGLCLLTSCAMPVAFSPVKIHSSRLPRRVQLELGVSNNPMSLVFKDGGLSKTFPSALAPGKQSAPVIVIDIEGEPPRDGSLFSRICFSVIKSKALDGVREARQRHPVTVITIPTTPELNKFAAKFDLTEEEGLWQYWLGLEAGRKAADEYFPLLEPFPFIPIRSTVVELGSKRLEVEQSEETIC
jgi:predicted acylesterase/phospholipase RssA